MSHVKVGSLNFNPVPRSFTKMWLSQADFSFFNLPVGVFGYCLNLYGVFFCCTSPV